MKVLERVNGLLENLHYGNSSHILYSFGIHFLQRSHVAFHKLPSLRIHHKSHNQHGNNYRDDTCQTEYPIEHKNQYGSYQRH